MPYSSPSTFRFRPSRRWFAVVLASLAVFALFDAVAERITPAVSAWGSGPRIDASKVVDRSEAAPGDVLTYTITVKNAGNASLHNVTIVEYLPNKDRPFVDYVAGSSTVAVNNDVKPLADRWVTDGARRAELEPNETIIIRFRVRIKGDAPEGQTLWNVANVKANERPEWIQCAAKTIVRVPPPPKADITITAACKSAAVASTQDLSRIEVVFTDGSREIFEDLDTRRWNKTFAKEIARVTAKSGTTVETKEAEPCPRPPPTYTISGVKFHDLDSSGFRDQGEQGLEDWEITLRDEDDDVRRTRTDGNGGYAFSNVRPGLYFICEVQQPGWRQTKPVNSDNGCWRVRVPQDDASNLEFGNFKIPPPATLTLIKNVVNDNGGQLTVSDFRLFIDTVPVVSGVKTTLRAGTYKAREENRDGYTASGWRGDCAADGTIALQPGQDATCTITNDDAPKPTITLIKNVVNDNGGTAGVADFELRLDGTHVASGAATPVNPGTHQASEVNRSGYAASNWIGDCAANGAITVAWGDAKTCRITNDDIAQPPPPATFPQLTITKDASVSSATRGSQFTYTVVVRNLGNGNAHNTTLTDVLPAAFAYTDLPNAQTRQWNLGSMAPNDSRTVSYTVRVRDDAASGPHVNTATAQASTHGPVSDTATVTVPTVLGEQAFPALYLVKTASVAFATPGGTVVYTLRLENRGKALAQNVAVTDTLPSGWSEEGSGRTTLVFPVGNLLPNGYWTTTITARVGQGVTPGTYRNVAVARADNHSPVEHGVNVEVRAGQVLGISTLPATGMGDGVVGKIAMTMLAIFVMTSSVLLLMARRLRRSPERLLRSLALRSMKE